MTRWQLDPWADDDPAIVRMREALEPRQPGQDAPGRPERAEVAPASTPPVNATPRPDVRARVAELLSRFKQETQS